MGTVVVGVVGVGVTEVVGGGGGVVVMAVVVGGGGGVVVGGGDGRWVVTTGGAVVTITGGGGAGGGGEGGGGGAGLGIGWALGGGGTGVGGGGTGLGTRGLTGGAGTGATVRAGGTWRCSTADNVKATPPIAVMATTAHMPMINCDIRRRRQGRSLGGSIKFSRIDQPAGPSSS